MQPQPSLAEADVGQVMEWTTCTREAAVATLAVFGSDVAGAIAYLSSHDLQAPAASFSASADLERIAVLEAHRRAGLPVDGSRLSVLPPNSRHGTLPAHILEHLARTGSPGPSDVAALMDGSSSLEAIIAVNDAVSRTRLERLLSEASQIQSNTSPIASLCCKYIRSIASSSTAVPIFEVNLILQFLAGSFSVRQQPPRDHHDDGDDDELPVPRGLRSGSVGVPSRGSSADAILDAANGLPISVLLQLFSRLCQRDVWGTRSILEDCASAAVGAVCYLIAVQLLTVTAGGIMQVAASASSQVSDSSWELILQTLPWLMRGRVHAAASLLLYLSACMCCITPSPYRFASFITAIGSMFPDGDAADRLSLPAPRSRARSSSPVPSAGTATTSLVSESVSAAVVAAVTIVFQFWYKDVELHCKFHSELAHCIDPLLSLLLSAWKAAFVPSGRIDSGSREAVASQSPAPLSADEREEVDYAVVRHSRSTDIAGLVQQQFGTIPNFHEMYDLVQASLGESIDDIVRQFRVARDQRIAALNSRVGNLLSRGDIPVGMASATQRDHLGSGYGHFGGLDTSSFSDSIRRRIISLLQTMLVGTSVLDPTKPELMPDSLDCEQLHHHLLQKRPSVYSNGNYTCDVCRQPGSGWVFHCELCEPPGWDAHPTCAANLFDESSGRPASNVQHDKSVSDLLHASRSRFFNPSCPWLTCACDELTVAFSQSTRLAEKLKTFLCEVMNIASGDGHSSRYQILHSLSCAALKSDSQNVIWGLAGVLLKEVSKNDISSCYSCLLDFSEAHASRSACHDATHLASHETQFASSFSLLIISITASLLDYATTFDLDSHVSNPENRQSMVKAREKHKTYATVVFDLVNCIQKLFELGSGGHNILIDSICRDFVVAGRYHAINRRCKDAKVSLVDSLAIISAYASKLQDFHDSAATPLSPMCAAGSASYRSAITNISEIGDAIMNRAISSGANDWNTLRAVACVLRLLSTQDSTVSFQEAFSHGVLDSVEIKHVPFLQKSLETTSSSDFQFCCNLLSACLIEMHRLISSLDMVTLANDFIVSGLIESLHLLLSDSSQSSSRAAGPCYLPAAVRRRMFYKIMCKTQKEKESGREVISSAFLRLIDLLKLSLDDYVDANRPSFYFGMHSAPSMRVLLHDLSNSHGAERHSVHGCECAFSRHDSQFLSKLQDALKFKDKRLLPQPRGFLYAYHQFGGDRREQGFTQTLSFHDAQDWDPLQPASAAPVRMWLCRRKCPLFNLERRRMFVKENGVIGCGKDGCGDETRSNYVMCQACSTAYKQQPPDYTTALEIFSSSSFSDAVLMLPHHSPVSADPITNRAGAVAIPGSNMVIYCGRNLGRDQIPGSNGVCGPNNGPQCADCAFSFPINEAEHLSFAETHQRAMAMEWGAPSRADRNFFGLPPARTSLSAAALSRFASPPSTQQPIPSPVATSFVPDPAIITLLVDEMGYNANAATRAVTAVRSVGPDEILAAAVEWLEAHQGDANLEEPLPVETSLSDVPPGDLPSPWIVGGNDPVSGVSYYVNTETGETTWVRPESSADGPTAALPASIPFSTAATLPPPSQSAFVADNSFPRPFGFPDALLSAPFGTATLPPPSQSSFATHNASPFAIGWPSSLHSAPFGAATGFSGAAQASESGSDDSPSFGSFSGSRSVAPPFSGGFTPHSAPAFGAPAFDGNRGVVQSFGGGGTNDSSSDGFPVSRAPRVPFGDASRVAAQPYMPELPRYPSQSALYGGVTTATNRTEFVIAFGSTLPDIVDAGASDSKLKWSVQFVCSFMDNSLSRTSVVSELLAVKCKDACRCMPIELNSIRCSHVGDIPPFVIAHSLERHQILKWYVSVAAIVGTQAFIPKLFCPAKRVCQIIPFSGENATCSVCTRGMIYAGSSVARSSASNFCVCEACCRNPEVIESLSNPSADSSDLGVSCISHSSNVAADLLEMLLQPRSFLPASDCFAENKFHTAMDTWTRLLRETVPSSSSRNASRPRHLVNLEERVSSFKKRVAEPQLHFRVSGLDLANVCESMKQIFDSRTRINLKLADAHQGTIDDSKLTVLFRHSEQPGQAAGMPANIHSDGITPVMYSILALEFSNPKKFAAEMWLPTCFEGDNVASCGLFPRPFIPDTTPQELKLQAEAVEHFLLLGRCIGIALRDRRVFMLPISLAFADALCGKKLSIWDACLGEIDLQEDDGYSVNHNALHAIEHCLKGDSFICFSMVYRGRTLSNQRFDVPVSVASFGSSDNCSMVGVHASITVDDTGSISVDTTDEVLQHVKEVCDKDDHVYVMFAGQMPRGLSSCRAYRVKPAKEQETPKLILCMDASTFPICVETQSCNVTMHVMRVHSTEDRAGDEYLRALEAYCLRSGIQMQIDAARRGIEEFVPLSKLEELCGDGLLEALGVTTDGERGISDGAWADFVNSGVYIGAEGDIDRSTPADMEIFQKALLLPSTSGDAETAKRWPSMKPDFCRWVFGYPRLPRIPRLKIVRSSRFFGHMCYPSQIQLPPIHHEPPFPPPYRFITPENRSRHQDPVEALLESLEVYCKDAMLNPMSE